ncbi:response regulator [Candidatus Aerophobetes bacterium]|nr:response regulator [Candidatus Aerophobetes bacterium]
MIRARGENTTQKEEAKILLVYGEQTMGWIIEDFLSVEGHEVELTKNPEEALRELGNGNPDLVLIGISTIWSDGKELLEKLSGTVPDSRVIMIAKNDWETDSSLIKSGRYDYISRPFHLDGLSRKVERALRKRVNQIGGANNG